MPAIRERAAPGTGLMRVCLERPSGAMVLDRPIDTTRATLTHPLQPDRRIAMARRSDAECLADELRHLDPDEIYEAALKHGLPRITAKRAPRSGN